jgi:hypothetical protein
MQSGRVARADKTAPKPEVEKGDGIEGLNASGAGYSLPTVGKGQPNSGAETSK